ncbi:MAG: hypothetical protein AAFN70_08130, partial [Planctomycetota bacterium]
SIELYKQANSTSLSYMRTRMKLAMLNKTDENVADILSSLSEIEAQLGTIESKETEQLKRLRQSLKTRISDLRSETQAAKTPKPDGDS